MLDLPSRIAATRPIQLRGVEVHNLQSIDLDLPTRRLIVFCGVSGSGKSSLAFDTLYAEGQRRYIESFSAYTRQFLERLEKPAAERIDGIMPAVAVAQGSGSRSNRSTVGTATELADYLRVLFARLGRIHCRQCGQVVTKESPQTAADWLATLPPETRCLLTFALVCKPDDLPTRLTELREGGFVRALAGGRICDLADLGAIEGPLYIVVDRLTAGTAAERLKDSLETAFSQGSGRCWLFIEEVAETWRRVGFSSRLACENCGLEYAEPEPRLFSFNSPLGACPTCEGSGVVKAAGVCPACQGARLRPEALAARVGGLSIAQVSAHTVHDAAKFFGSLQLATWEQNIARVMLTQIQARLGFLEGVGLGYLPLDRTLMTLSGGEAQRVALTSALGSSLVNMLYVLDEPTVGLHPADTLRLIQAIEGLRDRGNTVVVVDHDEEMIRAADQVVEIGPGAGDRGGRLVFQGTPVEMAACTASLTGDYLAGRRRIQPPQHRRAPKHGSIRLSGARGHNLKILTVDFPLACLCVVTGVSGSGKSTLVQDTLYPALYRRLRKEGPPPCDCDDVLGDGQIDDVALVDQSPIGRSPRSNPVTYVKAFDEIRAVFAQTLEARTRNYTASHFSFNVDGGRCTACDGDGHLKVDMQFLPDVYMKCGQCQGRRYRPEILQARYRGLNIAEVLNLTVREAFAFFRGQPKVQAKLKRLMDVGLDYLRLGQPANTLSGGEAQRLKLAAYVSAARRGRTLFILDEPTTGLHFADILPLLDTFEALLAVGHSLIVIEHNIELIKCADYVIDLGPGAAAEGGHVVAQGTPEEVARCQESVTGRYLARALESAE